jgi:hypothetical protein
MADTVTTSIIVNGARNLIMHFTNESDGTGESGVAKVSATQSTIHLTMARITYNVQGGSLRIQWNASSPTDMDILEFAGTADYTFFGGLTNPNNTGADGAINFTTVGFTSGSSYSVTLEMLKNV